MSSDSPKTRVTTISFEEEPTPWYKKWWVWLLALLVVVIISTVLYIVLSTGLLFGGSTKPISPLAS